MQILLTSPQFLLIINRLAQQLIENDDNINDTVFIGVQPRGVYVSDKIIEQVTEMISKAGEPPPGEGKRPPPQN